MVGWHQALCQILCPFPAGLLRHRGMKIGGLAIFAKLGWDIPENRVELGKIHESCLHLETTSSWRQVHNRLGRAALRHQHWPGQCQRTDASLRGGHRGAAPVRRRQDRPHGPEHRRQARSAHVGVRRQLPNAQSHCGARVLQHGARLGPDSAAHRPPAHAHHRPVPSAAAWSSFHGMVCANKLRAAHQHCVYLGEGYARHRQTRYCLATRFSRRAHRAYARWPVVERADCSRPRRWTLLLPREGEPLQRWPLGGYFRWHSSSGH